jgi:hypothetical protein
MNIPDNSLSPKDKLSGLPGKYMKFKAMKGPQKSLLIEAILFQIIAGFILKLLPFRLITRLFSLSAHFNSNAAANTASHTQINSIEIKKALMMSGSLSPWKNKCLVQALAARWMLNRRGMESKLSLGVAKGIDDTIIAHAWLKTKDLEVVEKSGDYLELYFF